MDEVPIFLKVLYYLRNNIEFDYPLVVRRKTLAEGYDGFCELKDGKHGKYFLITISKRLSDQLAVECLVHEISHSLSWDKEKDCHGQTWGVAYSKVYRKLLKFIDKLNS